MRPELRQQLRNELTTTEDLLLAVAPSPRLQRKSFGIWLFGIPWTVFSLGWTVAAGSVWFAGPPKDAAMGVIGVIFPLFGVPFIAVGLFMLGMPFRAIAEARRCMFGLTTARVIKLVDGRKTRTVESVQLQHIVHVRHVERRDGWGDVSLSYGHTVDSEGDRTVESLQLVGIPHVADFVKQLLAQQEAGSTASAVLQGQA
ncbi:MAG: hypothetical protein DI582_02300 [Azospirillum brasilense]|nr:MAG: hypothetical protein DI582_02300 [Azospirillum brasilense]